MSPHFFNANDDKMSQTEVYDFNVPTFGKGVVYDDGSLVRILPVVCDRLKKPNARAAQSCKVVRASIDSNLNTQG